MFALVPGGGSFNLAGIPGVAAAVLNPVAVGVNAFTGNVSRGLQPLEQSMGNIRGIFSGIQSISQALDVNFRAIQGDLGKILGSIDFGNLSLPNLNVRFDRIDFGKVFDVTWQAPDVKFTNPFASVDFSPLFKPNLWWDLSFDVLRDNPISNGLKWLGDRFMTASAWMADRDPFTWAARQVGVDWGPSGERKVVRVAPGERFLEATWRRVPQEFPVAVQQSATAIRDLYAQGKGRQVKDFHDSVEQTLRIGGAFAAGLGAGAAAAVEGLAKTVVAALDADTWRGLAAAVRTHGRNFMKADDKARFIAAVGQQASTSLENAVVATVDEWERASPEGRARLFGNLAGQIATEAVLPGMMTRIAGNIIPLPGHPPIVLGRKAEAAVERIASSKEFPAYAKKVRDAAGPNKKDLNSLLEGHRKSTGQSLAEQLRRQAGMDPEHARRLSEYARRNKLMIVVRSSNPNSLQYHGRKGFAAKPGDLGLKTNSKTGLVPATRRRDGALVDTLGEVVKGRQVDAQGWIVNTEKLVNGKPLRTNYRLSNTGHVVDAKGTRFFSDYDILTADKAPVAGTGWLGVPTGTKTTGSRTIVEEMNEAIVGTDRGRDMFKHGANRENLVKNDKGIYQVDTPEIGATFTVIDPDGTIFVGDRLYVKRLLEGRSVPTEFVVLTLPGDPFPDEF